MTCSKWVLLVDDEPMILSLLSRTLTDAGYLIKTAESGEQALEIAGTCEFDFMITDCLITGHLSPDIAAALERKEVLGWLQKPFTPDELQEILDRGQREC